MSQLGRSALDTVNHCIMHKHNNIQVIILITIIFLKKICSVATLNFSEL